MCSENVSVHGDANETVPADRVLVLPGWHGSGPDHWQSRWERLHGYRRVEQNDWDRPLRGDWSAQLNAAVLDAGGPVVLVAHSLGCLLVAWWAAHAPAVAAWVRGALLVAPPDLDRPDAPLALRGWAPPMRQRLPFAATVVASRNDPYATLAATQALTADWGAACIDAGEHGHLNADSALGDWPEGHALLQPFLRSRSELSQLSE